MLGLGEGSEVYIHFDFKLEAPNTNCSLDRSGDRFQRNDQLVNSNRQLVQAQRIDNEVFKTAPIDGIASGLHKRKDEMN